MKLTNQDKEFLKKFQIEFDDELRDLVQKFTLKFANIWESNPEKGDLVFCAQITIIQILKMAADEYEQVIAIQEENNPEFKKLMTHLNMESHQKASEKVKEVHDFATKLFNLNQ